ncbi:MAG: hypothetical protein R3C59_31145 [Planctomycetaceae bacterium]
MIRREILVGPHRRFIRAFFGDEETSIRQKPPDLQAFRTRLLKNRQLRERIGKLEGKNPTRSRDESDSLNAEEKCRASRKRSSGTTGSPIAIPG